MKKTFHRLLFLIAFLLFISSCADPEPEPAELSCRVHFTELPSQEQLVNTWKFVGFANGTSQVIDYPPCDATIKLNITDNLYTGNSSPQYRYLLTGFGTVNGFSASYEFMNDSTIITSNILSTLMGGSDYVMDYEEKLFDALEQNQLKYKIHNNVLRLTYNGSGDKMIFYR